ncbi:methyltransferase domain-containing protein [Nonomuraea sp. 3N208]|uniref:methyltransferase domain-containing protein n=1 Tax=Nonomuraea sp. 3N208 TaxID=3457421 RepID=UPI003FCC975E
MILDTDVLGYYERGGELTRLRHGRNRLEFLRTRDVLRRTLPPAPARVLDVGGGAGVHAEWLAADGYEVELIDPAAPSVRVGWSRWRSSAGTPPSTTASTTGI